MYQHNATHYNIYHYYKNTVYLHIRVGWPVLTDCVLLGLVHLLAPVSLFVIIIS